MDPQRDAVNLATHYINISNAALAQRRGEFPYRQLIALIDSLFSGQRITIRIEDEEGRAIECVTTRFVAGQFTPPERGVHDPDASLALKRSYLEEVMEHAEEYVRHPERLDWSWIASQLTRG